MTKEQQECPYCQEGWFKGRSGYQNNKVFFHIAEDGTLETMVNGEYGFVQGIKVCPFCQRKLGNSNENW